ncbi:MAG: hypothetical protein MMC33_000416 [Icmadophila ericetorum]|nr:hypothetical protein [Icmadophila ericetorum]
MAPLNRVAACLVLLSHPENPQPLIIDFSALDARLAAVRNHRLFYSAIFDVTFFFFFSKAFQLFTSTFPLSDHSYTRSEYICLYLLQQQDLPLAYQARCHSLLGTGNRNRLYYTRMSVRLWAEVIAEGGVEAGRKGVTEVFELAGRLLEVVDGQAIANIEDAGGGGL